MAAARARGHTRRALRRDEFGAVRPRSLHRPHRKRSRDERQQFRRADRRDSTSGAERSGFSLKYRIVGVGGDDGGHFGMIEPPAQDEVQSVEEAQTLRRDEQIGRLRGQPFACGLERRRSRDGVACPFQRFREPRHSRRSLVDDQDRIRHADTPATPRPTQRFSDAALTRTMQTAYAGKPVERTSAARQPVVLWNIPKTKSSGFSSQTTVVRCVPVSCSRSSIPTAGSARTASSGNVRHSAPPRRGASRHRTPTSRPQSFPDSGLGPG